MKAVKAWCEYYGYEINPLQCCNIKEARRITRNIQGKTQEILFISRVKSGEELTPAEAEGMPF